MHNIIYFDDKSIKELRLRKNKLKKYNGLRKLACAERKLYENGYDIEEEFKFFRNSDIVS